MQFGRDYKLNSNGTKIVLFRFQDRIGPSREISVISNFGPLTGQPHGNDSLTF